MKTFLQINLVVKDLFYSVIATPPSQQWESFEFQKTVQKDTIQGTITR